MNEVKATKNTGMLTGFLSEKNLEIVDDKFERDGKTIQCKTVKGEIVVSTDNGDFKLRVFSRSKKGDGEDNKMFKGFETIANTYISKVDVAKDSSLTADIISCSVRVQCNDYVAQDGTVKSGVQIGLQNANRVNGEVEHSTDVDMVGIIRSIKPETNKDGEETGRLVVEFVTIGYNGNAEPLTVYVEEDLASDFEDMYEAGQTCELYCSLAMKRVGGEDNKGEAKFGRKAKVRSGFDVLEIQVVGGEEPYDEEDVDENGNSKAYDMDTLKKLMSDRQIMLEALLNNSKEDSKSKKGSSPKKSGCLGTKKPQKATNECPF
ncbi:MAG: hypothetical protein EOM50_14320 [Erysipelotrichia bacterium]|nr:hypothetical protein [Erysipelotrichia bacterium]